MKISKHRERSPPKPSSTYPSFVTGWACAEGMYRSGMKRRLLHGEQLAREGTPDAPGIRSEDPTALAVPGSL